jgi:drug/metabolite transporter (DMT)-like permease
MIRLVVTGVAAAFFFSSTFVLNRAMSLEGGHWVWSAVLRFAYMIIFLGVWLRFRHGTDFLVECLKLFRKHWLFWILAGTIGFGLFYGPLCLASTYAPGWVIASTWQFTIVAGALIFPLFGKQIPVRALFISLLIFFGILMVNLSSTKTGTITHLPLAVGPILLAAFAYPIGNQMVGEAKANGWGRIPKISGRPMNVASARVLLMSLGSLPFWLVLLLFVDPIAPSKGQILQTAIVAFSSGMIATSLFLHARHSTSSATGIAAVDATQAAEIIFAIFLEILFLKAPLPDTLGTVGVVVVFCGLVMYSFVRAGNKEASQEAKKRSLTTW